MLYNKNMFFKQVKVSLYHSWLSLKMATVSDEDVMDDFLSEKIPKDLIKRKTTRRVLFFFIGRQAVLRTLD